MCIHLLVVWQRKRFLRLDILHVQVQHLVESIIKQIVLSVLYLDIGIRQVHQQENEKRIIVTHCTELQFM